MRSQQAKSSFSSGVLSPRLTLRSDSQKYQSALLECRNFYVSPQGGVIFRDGFKRYDKTAVPNEPNRLFQFSLGGVVSDIIVEITAGDNNLKYRVDGAIQPVDQSKNKHDYLLAELPYLYFSNRDKLGVVCHPNRPPLYIEQAVDKSIVAEVMPFARIPHVHYFDDRSPSVAHNGSAKVYNIEFRGTWEVGMKWYIIYGDRTSDNVKSVTSTEGEVIVVEGAGSSFPQWSDDSAINISAIKQQLKQNPWLKTFESEVTVTSTDATNYVITIIGKNAGKVMVAEPLNENQVSIKIVAQNLLESGTEPAWSYPYYVKHNGVFYENIKPHESTAGGTGSSTEPGVGGSWQDVWVDRGTTAPFWWDWQHNTTGSENPWEADKVYSPWGRYFPEVCAFRQQRLLFMNAKYATTGVWGSRIADYRDFALGAQSDDPFYFDIDTSDSPEIRWANSQRNLILGTSSGDYVVSSQVTLTPSDISAEKQNNARSHHTASVTINTDIIYVEQGQTKIRSTGYIRDLQAQSSTDISLIAEHLLRTGVKRVVLAQTPELIVYTLRNDGNLTLFSYSQVDGVGSWFEFETFGRIVDIAVAYSALTNQDEVWATVTYDGGVTHYIEKMPYPNRNVLRTVTKQDKTLLDQGIVCMDGWSQGKIVTGDNNIITGLEQYEGQTVGVLVDDAWAGEYVVLNGTVLLDAPDIDEHYDGDYVVGFLYRGSLVTFEMAGGNRRGTGLGTKRRWNKLIVRMLDSALPIVNGVLPPDRKPETLMGIPEIIQEGLTNRVIRNVGWGDGSVTIVQDRPYPTHVLGVYGEFSSNNA